MKNLMLHYEKELTLNQENIGLNNANNPISS